MTHHNSPSHARRRPPTCGVLSFSAGGDIDDIHKWRVVVDKGRSVRDLVHLFPDLEPRGFLRDPIVISVYPATLGLFDDALCIDTYQRPANLSRGLNLAKSEDRPVMLLGQPLPMAELLLEHLQANRPMPAHLLMLIGGYECPRGLEACLRARLASAGVEHDVVHGYGTAEVAAGCLMGRRGPDGLLHYRLATASVAVQVRAGILWLRLQGTDEPAVDTGDLAEAMTVDGHAGWRIQPSEVRVAQWVRETLDSWTAVDWHRYTGYLAKGPQGLRIQLRRGLTSERPEEVTFGRFQDEYEASFLDKPRWGTK
jgi:hypothetical protein